MQYQEALELALKNVTPTTNVETINIEDSLNRVLSKDIYALRDLPPYNNSAMDGYAFKYKDINNQLKVVSTILAGDIQNPILKQNECYKIMTGAKVPNDCDTVAPKEICKIFDQKIEIIKDIKQGNAIRLKGEEVKKGELLLKKGEDITASKIALLASQGITKIECFKELKVAIISTGSELKELGEDISDNEIYNINAINIKMHLQSYGIKADYLGTILDDLNSVTKKFNALKEYDILLTTGGVSIGDADFTKEALLKNGFKELFHGIKVKPGHPLLIGMMDKTFVIALPGNPLAAILHVILIGLPIIRKKQGFYDIFFNIKYGKIDSSLKLKPNRVNIVLGSFSNNNFTPYKNNNYGSGMILPLVESNSVALFGENIEYIEKGSTIKIIEFICKPTSNSFNYIM